MGWNSKYASYKSLNEYLCNVRGIRTERPSPISNPQKVRVVSDSVFRKWVGIKYFATTILKFYPDESIEFNTGGWHTISTRKHMSEFLPNHISVWALQRISFIDITPPGKDRWTESVRYLLTDGITVHPDLSVTLDGKPVDPYDDKQRKRVTKQDAVINNYVTHFIDKLINRELPQPSSGDCWFCALRDKDGKTMGDHGDGDHIREHLKEKYYVPSLLRNAIDTYGGHLSRMDMSNIGYWWKMHDQGPFSAEYTKKSLKRILTNYIRGRLGLGVNMGESPAKGY